MILVTGCTGFIGKHLVKKLLASGYEVLGLSRKQIISKAQRFRTLKFDIKDKHFFKNLKEYADEIEAVIHLAALVPKRGILPDFQQLMNVNVHATLNLLEYVAENCKARFIYASSASVYGFPKTLPVDETYPLKPLGFYPMSKLFGEFLCEKFREDGMQVISLRISAPYGPGYSSETVIPIFLNRVLKCEDIIVFGEGGRSQDFIYIKDVIDGLMKALVSEKTGIYNLGSGRETTMLALAQTILDILPNSTSRILLGTKPDPQESYRMCLDITKIQEELGFTPRYSLREGLKDFKENLNSDLDVPFVIES